jgi:hypothetical protein
MTDMRKQLYNVFTAVFTVRDLDSSDFIIIYPKSLKDYKMKFDLDEVGDRHLIEKVLTYGMEDQTPVDIVIKGNSDQR